MRIPAVLLGLALVVLALRVLNSRPELALSSAELPEPTYAPFEVQTASGALSLADLRGQAVVVYFGYTSCPDICPTTLATVGSAVKKLPPEQGDQVTALFVSVDPERDALDRIDDYARYFHPRFRAGTASPSKLRSIADDWGVYYRREETESALSYGVDHSTQAFLVDAAGRMVRQVPHGTSSRDWARLLREAIP
ncbi:MAG: SCO family protein [Myxococcota bacterium]